MVTMSMCPVCVVRAEDTGDSEAVVAGMVNVVLEDSVSVSTSMRWPGSVRVDAVTVATYVIESFRRGLNSVLMVRE